MKRSGLFTFLILGFMGFYSTLSAQNKAAMRKIESARIALITERLGLSPAQAERFWPIYNEYSTQRRQIRNQWTEARKGVDPQTMTEQQSQQMMNLRFEVKQKELNLEKDYAKRLRKVISSQQILSLRNAEDDFKRMLLQRIEQRRRQQLNQDRIKQRQEYMRKQGNN
jgi:hypothetical protein